MPDTDPSDLVCSVAHLDPITLAQLVAMVPRTAPALLSERLPAVQRMLDLGGVISLEVAAAILARVLTETESFRLIKEIPEPDDPHFLRYERGDLGAKLGNVHPGDGAMFRGVDLLQRTGRANARAQTLWCRANGSCDVDWETNPELTIDPRYLGIASAWYIATHGLADVTSPDEASCLVNADHTVASWIAKHGALEDWTTAHVAGRAGIYGLEETRQHHVLVCKALGVA